MTGPRWIAGVVERLQPPPRRMTAESVAALLPLMNLIRRARGERELSVSEAVEAEAVRPLPEPEEMAALLAEARARTQADEARIKAGDFAGLGLRRLIVHQTDDT
ncbi:hypothetical protein [Amycolatopsis sp. GM8]|uniref:hypothetical protein n=1 Tax=Amycolatopsis sp. GM8 TaxID=2896530 RepID=UPI001F2F8140|nr:hypothetical protein [Amycolatopsis sp. GM8]